MSIRRERLPGRNDLCPCGSGRKFKNCCRFGRQVVQSTTGEVMHRVCQSEGGKTCGTCQHWYEMPRLRGPSGEVDLRQPTMGQCREGPPVVTGFGLVASGQQLVPSGLVAFDYRRLPAGYVACDRHAARLALPTVPASGEVAGEASEGGS